MINKIDKQNQKIKSKSEWTVCVRAWYERYQRGFYRIYGTSAGTWYFAPRKNSWNFLENLNLKFTNSYKKVLLVVEGAACVCVTSVLSYLDQSRTPTEWRVHRCLDTDNYTQKTATKELKLFFKKMWNEKLTEYCAHYTDTIIKRHFVYISVQFYAQSSDKGLKP